MQLPDANAPRPVKPTEGCFVQSLIARFLGPAKRIAIRKAFCERRQIKKIPRVHKAGCESPFRQFGMKILKAINRGVGSFLVLIIPDLPLEVETANSVSHFRGL